MFQVTFTDDVSSTGESSESESGESGSSESGSPSSESGSSDSSDDRPTGLLSHSIPVSYTHLTLPTKRIV